jgi:nitrate reductase gamma subunit
MQGRLDEHPASCEGSRVRARAFLLIAGVGVLVVFGIPILFAPYWWADAFGWDVGPHTDLTTYFARVSGALVCVLAGAALLAARRPESNRWMFDIIAAVAMLMVLVHLRGLGAEPASEAAEIAFYCGFAALARWARPEPAR